MNRHVAVKATRSAEGARWPQSSWQEIVCVCDCLSLAAACCQEQGGSFEASGPMRGKWVAAPRKPEAPATAGDYSILQFCHHPRQGMVPKSHGHDVARNRCISTCSSVQVPLCAAFQFQSIHVNSQDAILYETEWGSKCSSPLNM